jgi:uncharacterized membrane protein YhhN
MADRRGFGDADGVRRRDGLLLKVGLLAAAGFFAAVVCDWPVLRVVLKAVPVLCLLAWLRPIVGRDARLIGLGLVLSLAGDVLLEASPRLFVPGLAAFLLAHVAYVAAYVGRTRALHLARLVPVAAFGVGAYCYFEPTLGAMKGPVIAYIVTICAMMWRALAQIGELPGAPQRAWLAAIGALTFAASDTMVAYGRFVAASVGLKITLMVLYWAAQVMIAASAERVSRE